MNPGWCCVGGTPATQTQGPPRSSPACIRVCVCVSVCVCMCTHNYTLPTTLWLVQSERKDKDKGDKARRGKGREKKDRGCSTCGKLVFVPLEPPSPFILPSEAHVTRNDTSRLPGPDAGPGDSILRNGMCMELAPASPPELKLLPRVMVLVLPPCHRREGPEPRASLRCRGAAAGEAMGARNK